MIREFTANRDSYGGPQNAVRTDALLRSQIYRDYQDAFQKASDLPLDLWSPETSEPARLSSHHSPFCSLMAETHSACSECLALQQRLKDEAQLEPKTLRCFAGLCESAAPVRLGGDLIAFLHTGHVLNEAPSSAGFNRIAKTLVEWGSHTDLKRFEEAYFHTKVLSPAQYDSFVRLLGVFAKHLATASGQVSNSLPVEHAAIKSAQAFITRHHASELSLSTVANAVNLSAGYFSDLFRQCTGLTFIDYLTRIRVAQAQGLLQNPRWKMSEVAFRAGFGSISQFNRAFKRIVGQSPRHYRETLPAGVIAECGDPLSEKMRSSI